MSQEVNITLKRLVSEELQRLATSLGDSRTWNLAYIATTESPNIFTFSCYVNGQICLKGICVVHAFTHMVDIFFDVPSMMYLIMNEVTKMLKNAKL